MKAKFSKEWIDFIGAIENAKKELNFNKNEECFFRGHLQSEWQLCPSLLRGKGPYKRNLISPELWRIECDLYYEFRSRARVLHNQEMSDWDVLFIMQHHLVPTRLLDWTEMLGVAIYFATLGCKLDDENNKSPSCIWLMNPYSLNEFYHQQRDLWDPENLSYYAGDEESSYRELLLGVHTDEHGEMFDWDYPIAIYPIRKNDRLINQGGYFTIHGNNILPIESLPDNEQYLRKVLLPPAALTDSFNFLKYAGINDFTMFPDLDGLAKYMKRQYLI